MHPTAAQSLLVPRPSKLVPFVAISLAVHLIAVGVMIAVNALLGPRVIDLDQKPITASLVRKGKERDEKLLPRKEELPPPPKEQKAPEAVVPPEPPKVVEKAVPVPGLKEEAPKPKVVGAKEGEQQKTSLFDAMKKNANKAKPEELEGKADGDENGDSAKEEGERYYALLSNAVKRNYDVSNTIDEAERVRLKALVTIFIGPGGELLDAKLMQDSQNGVFDSAVMSAIKKAAPFSPPPPHLRDALRKTGVSLRFTP